VIAGILNKQPADRAGSEIGVLQSFFGSVLQSIWGNKNEKQDKEGRAHKQAILQNALREMIIKSYTQGEIVFNYGDPGHEYFLIIRGRVSVRVPTVVEYQKRYQLIEAIADNFDFIIWKYMIDNNYSI